MISSIKILAPNVQYATLVDSRGRKNQIQFGDKCPSGSKNKLGQPPERPFSGYNLMLSNEGYFAS